MVLCMPAEYQIPNTIGTVVGRDRGALRQHVAALSSLWSAKDVPSQAVYINLLSNANQFSAQQQARQYAAVMLQSELCLVPAGDTPSSRRLFDAIMVRTRRGMLCFCVFLSLQTSATSLAKTTVAALRHVAQSVH